MFQIEEARMKTGLYGSQTSQKCPRTLDGFGLIIEISNLYSQDKNNNVDIFFHFVFVYFVLLTL